MVIGDAPTSKGDDVSTRVSHQMNGLSADEMIGVTVGTFAKRGSFFPHMETWW